MALQTVRRGVRRGVVAVAHGAYTVLWYDDQNRHTDRKDKDVSSATNEDKIHDLLVQIRQLVAALAPQAEAHRRADYELVSVLVAAAESSIYGMIDEPVLLALDMLSETLEAELADVSEPSSPESAAIVPEGTALAA